MSRSSTELVAVGRVGRPHGLDGSFFVEQASDDPERFADTVLSVKGDESLYERLREEHSVEPAGGRRVLESVPAGDLLANLLGVQPQSPLVFIESVTWDRTMEPFDCYQTWLRTDRMKIDIEVMAAPANAAAAADRIHAAAPVMTVE